MLDENATLQTRKLQFVASNSVAVCCPVNPFNSTRPLESRRATSKVRALASRPGINSARNVSRMPTVAQWLAADSVRLLSPSRWRRRLNIRVNQTAQAVGKEHVYLLRLNHSRHFAEAERLVHHHLSRSVGARRVIGRTGLRG